MPVLILFVTCICWGVSFPLGRALLLSQEGLASTWGLVSASLFLRFIIAAIVVAWWARKHWSRPTLLEWKQALGLGLFTASGMLFQIDALAHTEASTVAFLTQGYVVWIPLLLAVATRRWPPPVTIACCLVVLAGVAVLSGLRLDHLHLGRGEGAALLCSTLFAGQILWAERPGYATNRMPLVTTLSFVVAAMACLPVMLVTLPSLSTLVTLYADIWRLSVIVILGVVCTGIGMLLMFVWQRHVGAIAAALIYSTEPIWAAAFGFFLPAMLAALLHVSYDNEGFTASLVIGGGLILLANLVMQMRRTPPADSQESA